MAVVDLTTSRRDIASLPLFYNETMLFWLLFSALQKGLKALIHNFWHQSRTLNVIPNVAKYKLLT